jgi:hypothetical protein
MKGPASNTSKVGDTMLSVNGRKAIVDESAMLRCGVESVIGRHTMEVYKV